MSVVRSRGPRDRNRDGVLLAAVAQVRREGEAAAGELVAGERLLARGLQVGEGARRAARIDAAELADQRADEILPPLGHQHAERGEIAGQFRDDHLGDRDLARDRHRVQRPGAAERDHHGVARIDAAIDRDGAHRERHGVVDDRRDAERGRRGRQPELFAEPAQRAVPRRRGRASCRRRGSARR